MTEPITEANSLMVGNLFSKNLILKIIASVFPFVIEIGIVTKLNTKPGNSIS